MEKNDDVQFKQHKWSQATLLIVLCWVVYTCSYLGKLGYNANITQIENVYNISHAEAGIVSTFFFFAYGAGQIFNGLFCKRYPLRLVIFGSLLVSGIMNLLVAFSTNFSYVKYFWLINGAALSILWPSLIRLMSETLDKRDIGRAVVAMGTTVAAGTFLAYGLSALFVAMGSYVLMFFVAGTLLPLIAFVWIVSYPGLVRSKNDKVEACACNNTIISKSSGFRSLKDSIILFALFAIVVNLVKDGLTTWVPTILKESYGLPDYISILLTMILPLLAIFGTSLAAILHKKSEDFVLLVGILFLFTTLFIITVMFCLTMGWCIVTVGCFGVVSCLMASANNIITSRAPLFWRDQINSGLVAGVLNGFSYFGSTLSAYGLGVIADFWGWNSVFIFLFACCAILSIIAIGRYLFKRKNKHLPECQL